MAVPGEHAAPEVEKVTFTAPAFLHEKPALWFSHLEIQFELSGTTNDHTKFGHVVNLLGPRYMLEVEDVIVNPPATGRNEKIKQEKWETENPQFLRHLRSLAGVSMPDGFLRSLWLGRLPEHIQPIVTAQDGIELDALALLADRVHEVGFRPRVHEMTRPAYHVDPETTALQAQVEALTKRIEAMDARWSSAPRDRPYRRRFRSRSRSSSRNCAPSSAENNGVCWYHRTFAREARKCTRPCTYVPENS
ncbi:hypothetical protein J437_LFUL019320 [Ladona fulva]|uniref:DUF7041 domain-containing protein n=1 Tax=Ladona fulva TaxID=123851 RepID=A0A8K0KTF3_LADFU|nr:hypothetical protein J437_LFUL019320 [Ladona fulva]